MGLLDEAIREHLELKRRRGADATEVARQEREALEPIFPDEPLGPDAHGGEQADDSVEAVDHMPVAPPGDHAPAGEDHADLSSEATAELDMQAAMEEDLGALDGGPSADLVEDAPPSPATEDQSADQDSWGWDSAGESGGQAVPGDIPGQERLSFE